MNETASEPAGLSALQRAYLAYIAELRRNWLSQNRIDSGKVYEVMSPEEQRQVRARTAAWAAYVTPFAEAWWKERGYGVTWPQDDSQPVRLFKLQAA